jgi:hypothetical protein
MSVFDVASLLAATFDGLFAVGVEAPELTKAAEANPQALPRVFNAH